MARQFSDFTGVFFWNFKRMDNANYNFEVIKKLYKAKKDCKKNPLFNKPILVLLVSLIECILYDFVKRVNEHRSEVIPNLEETVVLETRGKVLDQLKPLIAYIQKHNLLRVSSGDTAYTDLDFLRKLRNRVHIQNSQYQLDEDEPKIWTEGNLKLAQNMLERVCEVLCHVYPRPKREFCSMSDFPRLWK